MKKLLIFIFAIGMIVGVSSTALAIICPNYASTITTDGRYDAGTSYTAGNCYFFDAGLYEVSVNDGAWSTWNVGTTGLSSKGWLWSLNIYQPTTGNSYILGNDSTAYASASAALSANSGKSILINQASAGEMWFYINDVSPHENTGSITSNIAVVPEPVSSSLFIIGGAIIAVRRFLKKKSKS